MAEILRLVPNKPEVIALMFTSGKPVTSPKTQEEQIMFTLTNGTLIFLDPPVARKIDSLNLGKGEPFEITMCQDRQKNKSYEVRYLDGATAPVPQQRPVSIQAPVQPSVTSTQPNGPAVGQVVFQPTQQNTSVPAPATIGGALMGCFMSAIDAIAEAQAYATRRGLGITFSAEDVRCTAISAYIGLQKGGR